MAICSLLRLCCSLAVFASPGGLFGVIGYRFREEGKARNARFFSRYDVVFHDPACTLSNSSFDGSMGCAAAGCACAWYQDCYPYAKIGVCSLGIRALIGTSVIIIVSITCMLVQVRSCLMKGREVRDLEDWIAMRHRQIQTRRVRRLGGLRSQIRKAQESVDDPESYHSAPEQDTDGDPALSRHQRSVSTLKISALPAAGQQLPSDHENGADPSPSPRPQHEQVQPAAASRAGSVVSTTSRQAVMNPETAPEPVTDESESPDRRR
eukprot:TRINITY_DN1593_c0_g1_i1.p1 TRINITY_DN1593_c0_g1~~TRINITY_DN1593_c0_g1_i1.p1  ORF type:complete len:265 (-),score=33.43 TRINITY_DN1593_c0_g1_i1:159-953(-)